MHRLFVAIHPPDEIRDGLVDLMEGLAGARWQSDEQLHLTLRFIGEVDRHVAGDVAAALGSIHHPGFQIAISGLGTFGRRGKPETLWAGVAPQEPVRALHKKVDQALAQAGVPPERRAFQPHITIARMGRGTGSVPDYLARYGGASSAPFAVTSFALYESQLTPNGAIHTAVESYPLA